MDEAALRAMLPMGFGKAKSSAPKFASSSNGSGSVSQDFSSRPSTSSAKVIQGPAMGPMAASRRKADDSDDDDDDEEDDGLTAEERAAASALPDDDDDDDEDGDGNSSESSADLGPEPIGADPSGTSLPLRSTLHLSQHTKSVSALSVDPSGARVATGSFDYDVRLWDFGGMSSNSLLPFKTFQPFGSYWIHDLAWSNNGEQLLAISGTSQPKLFDREGGEIGTFQKGDVYIRDMKQTAGHVAEVTSCRWMPNQANTFATSSADSTIRLWDVEDRRKQKTVISVKSKDRGARTKVSTHAFSHDGKTLAAACTDGALHLWSTSGSYSRPNSTVEGAHAKGTDTSCVVFSTDCKTLASRGGDDTLKLWDVRSFRKPLAERSRLPNSYGQTSVIFSSDERTVLTGTSASRSGKAVEEGDDIAASSSATTSGCIEVFSRLDLSPLQSVQIPSASSTKPHSVIKLQWHPKINQLFSTTSSGSCTIFYSPSHSLRGALLPLGKTTSRRARAPSPEPGEEGFHGPIITPGATDSASSRGQGQSAAAKKRRLERERKDPTISRIPQVPMSGPGRGGRIGSAATQHVVQGIFRDNTREEDPREALLRYHTAGKDGEEERKFTKAWEVNEPKKIYAKDDEDE